MEKRPSPVPHPRRRPPIRLAGAVLSAALALSACSGSSDGNDAVAPSVDATDSATTVPDFVPTPDDGGDDAVAVAPSTTEFDLSAQPSTPAIEPIPETGVPGIDSGDAFCRAWSEFAGSFQALALVSAVGDPEIAYRLEVIASSTVTAALQSMESGLPSELEAERVQLIADFAGPFFARAVVAEASLLAAGLEPSALRQVWLDALAVGGVDDPELDVVVPESIDSDALAAAVESFVAAQLPIFEDPALITDASIPLTEAYLAESCPDGGILAGNDVIND